MIKSTSGTEPPATDFSEQRARISLLGTFVTFLVFCLFFFTWLAFYSLIFFSSPLLSISLSHLFSLPLLSPFSLLIPFFSLARQRGSKAEVIVLDDEVDKDEPKMFQLYKELGGKSGEISSATGAEVGDVETYLDSITKLYRVR